MGIRDYGRMIKFSHSIFALPFAMASFVLAVNKYMLSWDIWLEKLLWILLAMVSARSAAMAFNRITDRKVDALNPRTKNREIPRGIVSLSSAFVFVILSSFIFLLSALMLNTLCFYLAFPVLGILLGYSILKRFWAGSHFILGLSLGIAPSGVWLALTGRLELIPVLLSLSVGFWTAGFDILYAIQDVAFDRQNQLHSLPADMGVPTAILFSRLSHGFMLILLVFLHVILPAGVILWVGTVVIAVFILYEHLLVFRSHENINKAFFNMNGLVSLFYFGFVLMDCIFLS
jgi:4-hydroxybenzoate polyprenyltransferase